QVRQVDHRRRPLMLDRVELEAFLLDLLCPRTIGFLYRRRVLAHALGARDLVARRVLRALERFELRDQPSARRFQRRDLLERLVRIEPAIAEALTNLFDVMPYVRRVEHATSARYCTLRFRRAFCSKSR